MLKNLHPLLTPELLYTLRAMGHGDELVICDCNFPAASVAADTFTGEPLLLPGVGTTEAAEAVLSVLPLDSFVEHTAFRMEVVNEPGTVLPVHQEFHQAVKNSAGRDLPLGAIERFAFYERAKRAYAVLATGERRGYGCFILVKGVLGPDGEVVWQ